MRFKSQATCEQIQGDLQAKAEDLGGFMLLKTTMECATVMQQPCRGRKFKHVFVCPKKCVWAPRSPTTSALRFDGEERDTARPSGEAADRQWGS